MRTKGRTDANQTVIVETLRAIGASVISLANIGNGCPDLLVGYHGKTYLLEVKTPCGKLTPDQVEFIDRWDGADVVIVRSPGYAIEVVSKGLEEWIL
jgi:Holliday junction resolvase